MVNKRIVEYLKEGKKRGYDFDSLKHSLIEHGYAEEEIQESLDYIKRPKKEIMDDLLDDEYPENRFAKKGKSGVRWMKISGIIGVLTLVFIAMLYLGIFIPILLESVAKVASNDIAFFLIELIVVAFSFVFYFGFFRMGRFFNSGMIKMASISVLILLVIGFVTLLVFQYFIFPAIGEGLFSGGSLLFGPGDDLNNFGNIEISSLVSLIPNEIKVALIIAIIYLILTSISIGLLGIGLVKSRNQLKMPISSGIVFLISGFFGLSVAIYASYLLISILSGNIDFDTLLQVSLAMQLNYFVLLFNALYVNLLGSITLFEASRKFE